MSLGFKLFSYFNGTLKGRDPFGNSFYESKKDSSKRWVLYANTFGPESLPTQYHNWLHSTSDRFPDNNQNISDVEIVVKKRVSKHTIKKKKIDKGYSAWKPKI